MDEWEEGVQPLTPWDIADKETKKYTRLWQPTDRSDQPDMIRHPELLHHPRFSQRQVLKAGQGFPARTAESYDGLHVRHWGRIA